MLRDYLDLMLFLKKNVEPISANALAKHMKMFNTTIQSRLEELERVGLVEKFYRSKHTNLWQLSYKGKAVLELMIIIEDT